MNANCLPDGGYLFHQIKDQLTDDFTSEKEMCDYIELNIESFVRECMGYEILDYKREFAIVNARKRIKGNRRIDFIVITKCGKKIGLECKRPVYISDFPGAVGQCLSYLVLFEQSDIKLDEIILVCTKMDILIADVISRFQLPVSVMGFDKSKHILFSK